MPPGIHAVSGTSVRTAARFFRLNGDGTTPSDQPMATPVYAYGYSVPVALDWQPGTRALWAAGRDSQDVGRLRMVGPNEVGSVLGAQATSDAPPRTTNLVAMTFYRSDLFPTLRGDLLVAGGDDPTITRLEFDSGNPAQIVAREPLLEHVGGIIRALAVSPEGAIYFCVNDELLRLVAGRSR